MIKNARNWGTTRFNPFSSTGNSFGLGVSVLFSFSFLGPEQKREKNSGWNLSETPSSVPCPRDVGLA